MEVWSREAGRGVAARVVHEVSPHRTEEDRLSTALLLSRGATVRPPRGMRLISPGQEDLVDKIGILLFENGRRT